MISRRRLLIALGLSALAPVAGVEQKTPRVGFFSFGSRQSALETGRYAAFLEGMRELGYVEGKNLIIDGRYADGRTEYATPSARRSTPASWRMPCVRLPRFSGRPRVTLTLGEWPLPAS